MGHCRVLCNHWQRPSHPEAAHTHELRRFTKRAKNHCKKRLRLSDYSAPKFSSCGWVSHIPMVTLLFHSFHQWVPVLKDVDVPIRQPWSYKDNHKVIKTMLSRVVLVKILREGFDLAIGHFTMWHGSMTCQNCRRIFKTQNVCSQKMELFLKL